MSNKKRALDAVIDTAITKIDVSAVDDVVVAALITDVRSTITGEPPPARGELQTMLTGGFDAEAVVAQPSESVIPVPPSSAPTVSRRPKMLQVALAKIAGLTLVAKIGLAGAAVAATATGAGAAGALPPPAQEAFDRVAVFATTSDDEDADVQVEPGDDDSTTAVSEEIEDTELSGEADFEREPGPVNDAVREVIEGTDPQDRDREFGQEVADTASQNRQDTAVRNSDDADDEDDNGAGVQQRDQRAPGSRPVDPPAIGQGPPQN